MEQLIIKGIDKLVKLERENGRLGSLVGILLMLVVTFTAIGISGLVFFFSLAKFIDWVNMFFFGCM